MSSLDEESLRKMSYSELKKHAKKRGVKVNMKAENIIATILKEVNKDEDSFVTLERSIINSCKKNKENLFDKDKQITSETPRRDTYTVTSPLKDIEVINDSLVLMSASPELKKTVRDESLNVTLTRGSEKKTRKSTRKVSFVTPLRRSTRFSSATPQYNSVKDRPKTPMPSRLSSTQKHVSFKNQDKDSVVGCLNLDVSECNDSKGPYGGKIRRPSTPMPLSKRRSKRISSTGIRGELCISPDFKSTPKVNLTLQQLQEELHEPNNEGDKTAMTSLPTPSSSKRDKMINNGESKTVVTLKPTSLSTKKAKASTPGLKKDATILHSSLLMKQTPSTSEQTKKGTPLPLSNSMKKTMTSVHSLKKELTPLHSSLSSRRTSPRFGPKTPVSSGLSSSSKNTGTPNFNKLHQKQFDKMESIDEYQKRKVQNSAKKSKEQLKYHYPQKSSDLKKVAAEKTKKIPTTFSGIPFVPTTSSTIAKSLRLNTKLTEKTTKFASANESALSKKLAIADTVKKIKSVTRENAPLKQRHKFDLKASLAKRLPYKPHAGPLKPLTEVNLNNTVQVAPSSTVNKNENENVIIKAARTQSREVLRGVRKNKRFLLQMNNRRLNTSIQ